MSDFSLIIVPLTIIPWVALVLASTASRFNYVASEINKYYLSKEEHCDYIVKKQLLRSRLFTNILVGFYLSIFFLFLSSFVWVISNFILGHMDDSKPLLLVFFTLWIFFSLFSVVALLIESFIVRKVIRKKIEHIIWRGV